ALDRLVDDADAFDGVRAPGKQRVVALDDIEDVVEVMRDAGRERSDAFELLRLPELLLEPFLLLDVFEQSGARLLEVGGALLHAPLELFIDGGQLVPRASQRLLGVFALP